MIYAKVDVKLRDHIRAQRAGEAMATWTWGLLYTREQETDGLIPREALERSWCPKLALVHAKKLVEVGLWEVIGDHFTICRYSAKNETKEVIVERRSEARDRMLRVRDPEKRSHSVRANKQRTNSERTDLFSVGSQLVPGSGSGSDSGSSPEEIQIPEAKESARAEIRPGSTAAYDARARYADAVRLATGDGYALSRAPYITTDLCDVLNHHAPPGSQLSAIDWVVAIIPQWIGQSDPKFQKGYAPGKLLEWLNAGKPDRATRNAAEVTKQGFDPEAPWMKLPETGT